MPIVADPTPVNPTNPTTPATPLYAFDGKLVYDDATLDILPGASVVMYATLADAQADAKRLPLYSLLGQPIGSLTANAKGYVPSWRCSSPRGVIRAGTNYQSVISFEWVQQTLDALNVKVGNFDARIGYLESR